MWHRACLVVLVAASACYAPQPSAGAPCGPGDSCPSGLSCIDGRCVTGGSETDSGVDPTECMGMPDGTTCGNTASSECNPPDTCVADVCTSNEAMTGAACYDCAAGPTGCASCNQGMCQDAACQPNGTPMPAMLTSPAVGGNADEGNMFDVVASEAITIAGFETRANMAATTEYEIWTKPGTHVGFEGDASAWTLVGAATFATVENQFTPIPIPVHIKLAAGQRQAFYLTHKILNNRYHNGTAVGAVLVSTPHLTLYEGAGINYGTTGFAGTNTPRAWEGAIHYRRGGGDTLATAMVGTLASDGVMFDVTPTRELHASLLGLHLAPGTHDIDVYFRRGTFAGAETEMAQWKPLATAKDVASAGPATPTFLPMALDVALQSGAPTAFYVVTSGAALRSQPTSGSNAASNPDVLIGHGVTISGSFGAIDDQVMPNVELGYGVCQ